MTYSRQILDDAAMCRPAGQQHRAIGQLEVGEVETRCHGTAHERVGAAVDDTRAVPGAGGDDDLRFGIPAELHGTRATRRIQQPQRHGIAGVMMPDLVGLDPVQR